MNNAKIFSENGWLVVDSIYQIPTIASKDFLGHVYALEYGDKIKIGMTTCPESRAKQLESLGRNYGGVKTGRIAISIPHTNFSNNENFLHAHFAESRCVGSELFNITFEDFISNIPELEFKDDSEMCEVRREVFTENMKQLVLHGVGGIKTPTEEDVEVYANRAKDAYFTLLFNNLRFMTMDKYVEFLNNIGVMVSMDNVLSVLRSENLLYDFNNGACCNQLLHNRPTLFSTVFDVFACDKGKGYDVDGEIDDSTVINEYLITNCGQVFILGNILHGEEEINTLLDKLISTANGREERQAVSNLIETNAKKDFMYMRKENKRNLSRVLMRINEVEVIQ